MPCYFCRHFNEREAPPGVDGETIKTVVDSVEKATGACTLSPTWESVTGLHYCSQLSPREAYLMGRFWTGLHEASAEGRKEREQRLAAEKKLKELRSRKVKQ